MPLRENFNPIRTSIRGSRAANKGVVSNLALWRGGAENGRMHLKPMGDAAVVIELGNVIGATALAKVRAATAALDTHSPEGTIDVVPSFTSVTVLYDPARIGGYESYLAALKSSLASGKKLKKGVVVTVTVPVCYGGEHGPDLEEVAQRAKLSAKAVISLHAKPKYMVGAVGFTPGFPYLAGLPKRLHTPRRREPRKEVPAGSVGIGGAQTGVYPQVSPGGWNLIGRTPLKLFNVEDDYPALFRVGDQVQFKPINEEEFAAWK